MRHIRRIKPGLLAVAATVAVALAAAACQVQPDTQNPERGGQLASVDAQATLNAAVEQTVAAQQRREETAATSEAAVAKTVAAAISETVSADTDDPADDDFEATAVPPTATVPPTSTARADSVATVLVIVTATPAPTPIATATPRPAATVAVPAPTATMPVAGDGYPAPQPRTPAGSAIIAIGGTIGAQNGLISSNSPDFLKNWGVTETLFRRAPDDSTLPWLGTAWSVAPNLSSGTVDIKTGVPFQIVDGADFGTMTAFDVAWSMNMANSLTNPESIHGQAGDFAGLWSEWLAVDDDTISFNFQHYDATWVDDFLNQSGQAFSVFSKTAFDTRGADWVRDRIVGTGVYQVESWSRDDRVVLTERPDHHLFEAKTSRIELVLVPEAATRSALLRVGEVDIANLEPSDAANFDLTQFTQTSAGGAVQLGVFFSGNLWEDVSASDGSLLPTKATFVHDLAWIGRPDGRHGSDDLEQSRQIRRAMAIAIDRDAINTNLLSGLGRVVHVEYFSTGHRNWDSRYEYPYDPDEAIRIIQAQDPDYRRGSAGSNGILGDRAFEVSIYAGPELGGGTAITGEIADAVAGFWQDIGLTTFVLKFSYQTFRPGVVGRTNTHPWITSCDKGRESNPWHFPKGLVQTTLTRGGFSCGFESPVILELYYRMAGARDQAEATAAANEYLAYVYEQVLQPGVVAVPESFFFNNRKIRSFHMDKAASTNLNSLWNIELQ